MELRQLRVINCFGFADASANLEPRLVYVLGRNSSGKTSLLDAINQLAPDRVPEKHPRFQNFRPTDENSWIVGQFHVDTAPDFNVVERLLGVLRARGVPARAISEHGGLESANSELTSLYASLAAEAVKRGFFTLHKYPSGACQITAGDDFKAASERRKAVDVILRSILPSGTFTHGSSKYPGDAFASADLDREVSLVIPDISYYSESYNLTDNLPDFLTTAGIEAPMNGLTAAFVALLSQADIAALLTTNDPDEQDRLRQLIQERATGLASRITTDAARLIEMTVSLTSNGLQITLRTDRKKSFYRQMSEATKFLIAYHIYAHQHTTGGILLFDEPTRGLHATAEHYVRIFLERLAETSHVIVSTHSEHLLDVDHLDRIRLMQQDKDDRPMVVNSMRPPRDRRNFLLALQPVFDAIGLSHQDHVLTNQRAVLTEGLTDYLYIRGFQRLTARQLGYQLVPGRGQGALFTLVPFMMSQGVQLKILLDGPELKKKLQDAYGIADTAMLMIIGTPDGPAGIEDVFSRADYQRILNDAGYEANLEDLERGNSVYAKQTNKRLVAQTFLNHVDSYSIAELDESTRAAILSILEFCEADNWWRLA